MSVETLTADAQFYASSVLKDSRKALSDAKDAITNIGYTQVFFNAQPLPTPPASDLDLTPPTLSAVDLTLPAEPSSSPNYQDIGVIDPGLAPALVAIQPTYTPPTKPSQLADFQDTAPTINLSVAFPDPPSSLSTLIDAPLLPVRTEPAVPQVTLPSFGAIAPANTTVAPTGLDLIFQNAYASAAPSTITMVNGYVDAMLAKYNPQYAAQMAAIEAQLTKYLAGGTGLNVAVENAIYERARTKNSAEANRVRDTAYVEAAARGFTIPSGALMSAMQQARQAGADNNAQATREIVVMQAEMEQRNLQFAVTTSTVHIRQCL